MKSGKIAFRSVRDEDFLLREGNAEKSVPRGELLAQKAVSAAWRIAVKAAGSAHLQCRLCHGTGYRVRQGECYIAYSEVHDIREGVLFFVCLGSQSDLRENIVLIKAPKIFICRNQVHSSVSQ